VTGVSLARRTVSYLILAQFVAFALAWMATLVLGLVFGVERFTQSWDELSSYRYADMAIASLKRDAEGRMSFEPIPALREEMQRLPRLRYAAFDFRTKEPVAGSAPELVATLSRVIEVSSTHTHFVLPDDPETPNLGFMEPMRTPYGRFLIAIYRHKFRGDDILRSMREELLDNAAYFVLAALLTGATAWFAVRQGLLPLRAAAERVAHIDMGSLDQRLRADDAPQEVAPFVEAVNEALARLDASAARQRRFTANAAHELRTPLAIMRARLEDENAKLVSLKRELLGDAGRLRAIVEQMLVAARLTEGQLPLDQCIDLSASVATVVSMILPLAMDRGRLVDFDADPEAEPPTTMGNERAIECVLTNLIDNALRAEPKGGTVLVRVDADGIVRVSDHGEGIAPEDRNRIFEPFWRKNEASPGAGLGLAISREIMDAHGGRIWIEKTPGGGATFALSFPILGARERA
jgi:two-component system OmpR family sensor kinase